MHYWFSSFLFSSLFHLITSCSFILYFHFYSSEFVCVSFFVCFNQKTAYEVRISDWSSDVCSSDLDDFLANLEQVRGDRLVHLSGELARERERQLVLGLHDDPRAVHLEGVHPGLDPDAVGGAVRLLLGLASTPPHHRVDRKTVVSGQSLSVRCTPGGRRTLK